MLYFTGGSSLYVLRLTRHWSGQFIKNIPSPEWFGHFGLRIPLRNSQTHYLLGFSYSAGSLVAINCHKKLCCFGCLQFTLDITEECFDLSKGGRSSGLHICFFSVKKAQGKPKLCKMYTLDILMNGYNVMPWYIFEVIVWNTGLFGYTFFKFQGCRV